MSKPFSDQVLAIEHNTNLQDLFKINVSVNYSNLSALFAQVLHCVTQQAQYLDKFEHAFASKEYVAHEIATCKQQIQNDMEHKYNQLHQQVQQIATDVQCKLPALEKKMETWQKHMEDMDVQVHRQLTRLEEEQQRNKQALNKCISDCKHASMQVESLYNLFGLQEKQVLQQQQQDLDTFLLTHANGFKALAKIKANQTAMDTLQEQMEHTNGKIISVKEAIKKKLEKIIDDATGKKVDKRLEHYHHDMMAQIDVKANYEHVMQLLADKVSKKDMLEKVDHSYVVKLVDRLDTDVKNRLQVVDNCTKQLMAVVQSKVDKSQVDDIANRVEIATKNEELNQLASIRFKCLGISYTLTQLIINT